MQCSPLSATPVVSLLSSTFVPEGGFIPDFFPDLMDPPSTIFTTTVWPSTANDPPVTTTSHLPLGISVQPAITTSHPATTTFPPPCTSTQLATNTSYPAKPVMTSSPPPGTSVLPATTSYCPPGASVQPAIPTSCSPGTSTSQPFVLLIPLYPARHQHHFSGWEKAEKDTAF